MIVFGHTTDLIFTLQYYKMCGTWTKYTDCVDFNERI